VRLFAAFGCAAIAAAWTGCAPLFGIDSPEEVPPPVDASTVDSTATDGSAPPLDGCAAIVAHMLASPIRPPNEWAGLDLTNGGQYNDVPGSGGLTLTQAGVAACALWTEPATLPPGVAPVQGGYREAVFGGADVDAASPTGPLLIQSNLDTGALYFLSAGPGYSGTLSFHSRDGTHTYEIGIGFVHRDGADYPPDWPDSGFIPEQFESHWVDELYDALNATYSPATPALTGDCRNVDHFGYYEYAIKEHLPACQYYLGQANGETWVGLRTLPVFFTFDGLTSRTTSIYIFWFGGITTCANLIANRERMDYAGIGPGADLGGLHLYMHGSNLRGMTWTEANEIECNYVSTIAPDPGYGAIQWGPLGEVLLEYDPDSGVNYRAFAREGYQGSYGDGLTTAGIGTPLQVDGGVYAIDWDAAAIAVTPLANYVCATTDGDCADAGNCTIVPDDGHGNSYFGFSCGAPSDRFGVTFPKGTNVPKQIMTTNTAYEP
jgi:hypothetical protein